jgi:hypothetical protein
MVHQSCLFAAFYDSLYKRFGSNECSGAELETISLLVIVN